jgi:KaiC/GvpD/RAD55 family RecA-like ATPase
MNAIIKGLVEGDISTQRIMVISGLGGSGKTQLSLKFAHDFQERCASNQ